MIQTKIKKTKNKTNATPTTKKKTDSTHRMATIKTINKTASETDIFKKRNKKTSQHESKNNKNLINITLNNFFFFLALLSEVLIETFEAVLKRY